MRQHKNIIVTLMHDKPELTERLLNGLYNHEAINIDGVIIVDNGSTSESWTSVLRASSRMIIFPIVQYPIPENIGFTLGANYGIMQAQRIAKEGDLIFLISNDVQINGKFIDATEDILRGAKRALVGNKHINWDSGWNTFNGKTFDYLEGYFLAATSFGWRDLNYFDPNYAPFDYEDVDISTTAKQNGYKLTSLNNPNIVHQGGGTLGYNPEREEITLRNKEYFKNKWVK